MTDPAAQRAQLLQQLVAGLPECVLALEELKADAYRAGLARGKEAVNDMRQYGSSIGYVLACDRIAVELDRLASEGKS